ncbi:hypothetical protein H5410_020947 [Solanum commersonii]|uniref:Vesicle transport protein n=1 Tax=Solanum commersonii TaxID=4109 RepID=A0A9J5ZAJ5_SOLCO|nr:hypothetical protein H5410_020947 [Solanum commersonii]
MEKMNQALEKMKMLVGMDVEDEEVAPQQESSFAFVDDLNRNCTLSTKQRLYGFAICLTTGIACTLLSMLVFFNPIKFGITFSFGNLLALGRAMGRSFDECLTEAGDIVGVGNESPRVLCLPVLELEILTGLAGSRRLRSSGIYLKRESFWRHFKDEEMEGTAYGGRDMAKVCTSTAFLIGPKRQVTMMLDPVRIYATAIYIASIIIALFCALYVRNKLLTLLSIILEFGALIWYSLSYIPFARSMVSKVMMACFDTEF